MDDLYNVVNRYGQRYALIGTVTDTFNEEHQIFMDAKGQKYVDYGGKMHSLPDEVLQKINNGQPVTREELSSGKVVNTNSENGGEKKLYIVGQGYRKDGGSIPKIRPLPVSRYQTGSKFMTTKTTAKDIELKDDPLNHGASLNTGQNLAFKD